MAYAKPTYYRTCTYIIAIILGLYWSISIPFTRYLLGAHSLDQIVFGSTLGVFEALVLHFVVRDNLMCHIDMVLTEQNLISPEQVATARERHVKYFQPESEKIGVSFVISKL